MIIICIETVKLELKSDHSQEKSNKITQKQQIIEISSSCDLERVCAKKLTLIRANKTKSFEEHIQNDRHNGPVTVTCAHATLGAAPPLLLTYSRPFLCQYSEY